MRVSVRHQPSFAVVRVELAPGEQVRGESGSMAAHSWGVEVQAQMQGGLMRSLSRSVLGGESLYVTTFTAHPEHPGWVDLAARLPGDALVLDVEPSSGLVLTRGSWLASDAGVELDTRWGGASSLFGGEGGFVVHATGRGTVVGACYGALDRHDLPEGGGFTVDTGHVVAYEDRVQPRMRKVSRGVLQSMKSGEGWVFDFQGPGTVWTQSRNPTELVGWLAAQLPNRQ
ncbi:TIGR00266 family protein [Aquipuribacter nitratireducens]|uniref:TIGR00266 family protein n=1 Tax=Aquipuribacter nitratireducens TaxID=650104 RepID=A0ABW0GJF4_9MICO